MRGWSWIAGFLILVLVVVLAGCASRADHEACRRQLRESRHEMSRLQAENASLRDQIEKIKKSLSADELLARLKGKLDTFEALMDERGGRRGRMEAGKLDREKLVDMLSQMRLIIRMLGDIQTRAMDDRNTSTTRP